VIQQTSDTSWSIFQMRRSIALSRSMQ